MMVAIQKMCLVGVGGALGAMGRYLLGGWIFHRVEQQSFPFGTFVVNVLGCLVIGILAGLGERYAWLDANARLFLITGLLGGFTTFSAFGLESLYLLRRGELALTLLYIVGSVSLGIVAVWLGFKLSGRWVS